MLTTVTIVILFVCGGVLLTANKFPLLERARTEIWAVHYATCSARHGKNVVLLSSDMCDRGANELAFRDKVNCDLARSENAWGVEVCTLYAIVTNNSLADAARHIHGSWPAFLLLVGAILYGIKSFWSAYWGSRADVQKHRVSMEAFSSALQEHRVRQNPDWRQGEITNAEHPYLTDISRRTHPGYNGQQQQLRPFPPQRQGRVYYESPRNVQHVY